MATSAIPSSTNCSSQTSAVPSTLSSSSQGATTEAESCYFSDDEIEGTTCAISLEKMKDPVMLGCGHSFERSFLQTALKASRFCPTCREPAVGMVKNYNLASSIEALSKHGSGKIDVPALAKNIVFPNTIKGEEGNTPDKTFAEHLRGIFYHHPDKQIPAIANEICLLIDEDLSRMPAIDFQSDRALLTYKYEDEEGAEQEVVVKVRGRAAWALKSIVDRVELTLFANTPGFAERIARFIVNPSKFAEESRSAMLNKYLQAALFSTDEEKSAIQEIAAEVLNLIGQDPSRLPLITVSPKKKQAALEVPEKDIRIEVSDDAALALKQIKMTIQQTIKQKEQTSFLDQTLKEMLKTMKQMEQNTRERLDRLEQQSAPAPFTWKRAVVPLIPLAAGVLGRYAGCMASASDPSGSCSATLLPTVSDLPSLGVGIAGIANLVYNGVDPSFTSYLSAGLMTGATSYTYAAGEARWAAETTKDREKMSSQEKRINELETKENSTNTKIEKLQQEQETTKSSVNKLEERMKNQEKRWFFSW